MIILRSAAQMTYQRTILLRIQKLDGKAYGWEDTIACERRWSGNIVVPHQAGTVTDSERRAPRRRMT